MYCGSCLHDNTLARALHRLGHDVALVPTYTPMRSDEPDFSLDTIFYGAINVYLQQKLKPFRHTPRALDRLLDARALLGRLDGFAGSTRPAELAALTLSVLRGEHGHHRKELERLTRFLRHDFKPELVHLSSSLFLGFARSLRHQLGVPLVCSLQGEDLFLDGLGEPHRGEVVAEMRARANDVDRYLAPSVYYQRHMAAILGVATERIAVVPLGVLLDHEEHGARPDGAPFTIGYLGRLAPEKGLPLLLEAFARLGRDARLRVAGYIGPGERQWVDSALARASDDRIELVGEVDRAGKIAFLHSLDVLALPTLYREAKGLPALEAMACGVPVVAPDHGGFPEMLAATQGGLLYEAHSADALAAAIARLRDDVTLRRELGRRGQDAVRLRFGEMTMAETTVAVYTKVMV